MKKSEIPVIAENKKAFFNYAFVEQFEVGLVLEGWEVKSIAAGKVQLTDGYLHIKDEELFIIGLAIQPLKDAKVEQLRDRTRKVLMKKADIKRLIGKIAERGFTLVPINLHWTNGKVKCSIALAKGKVEYEKRDTIKERETKREVERAIKNNSL